MNHNNNNFFSRITGKFFCVDCKKRFQYHNSNAIKACPYCKSNNWYLYKEYKSMVKKGYIVK